MANEIHGKLDDMLSDLDDALGKYSDRINDEISDLENIDWEQSIEDIKTEVESVIFELSNIRDDIY